MKNNYYLFSIKDSDNYLYKGYMKDCIEFADLVIRTMSDQDSFLSLLNELQTKIHYDLAIPEDEWEKSCFSRKSTIPEYYLNLILIRFNMQIRKM